jgi:general secretion pathway protein D
MNYLKFYFFIAIATAAFVLPTSTAFSQDADEDTELIDEAEEIPPPMAPATLESGATDAPPAGTPSRFRPSSRFGGNAPTRFSAPPSGGTPSFGDSGESASPLTVTPVAGRGKMSFADAHPEDITNKNFPDIVESFDYKNAPIMDVVNAMARLTGKNFIFDQTLTGTINIIAPRKVTVAEAWNLFLSALSMNNLTVVPAGKFLKIRKIEDAKNDSIEMYNGAYYPTGDQLITRLIRLKYISAEEIVKTFDKILKSKAGSLAAYDKTNSLIVTDLGSNVDRISRILVEMDKPGFEERLEVIPIKHAKSKDMADLITKIINKGEDKTKNTFRPASRFGQAEKNEAITMVSPDERTNSIIVLANNEGVQKVRSLVSQLDYPLDMSDAGGVHVYYVKHGEAKKIADTLNGIAQETEKKATTAAAPTDPNNPAAFKPPTQKTQLFGSDVVIKADENTNALIITGSKQDYATVLSLLQQLDLAKDQVYVEAYIVEMDASKTDNWSFNILKFGGATGDAATTDNGIARAGYVLGSPTTLSNLTTSGGVFGFGGGDNVLVNLGDGKSTRVPSLLGFIELLKSTTSANVLSKPQLMAMDNEEAEIVVGDDIPVGLAQNIANNGQTSQLPQFKEAVISLKIKPFISPDSDIVTLNVEQNANDVSTKPIRAAALAAVSQGLKKRKIKTNLTLRSGDTAVLGGLIQDGDSLDEKKIPLLGDIPVIGWLFKSRNVQRIKNNLMVFITPKIVRNSSDHKKLTKTKITDRVEWIKRNANGRDPFGKEMEVLAKYADSADEFQLEDQGVAPAIDSQPTDGENEIIQ